MLTKGVAQGLAECSEDISRRKREKLAECLSQLDLNNEEKVDKNHLTKNQIGELIRAKLIELRIADEDNLHARIVDSVWRKGVSAALDKHKDSIAPKKLATLVNELRPLEEKLNAELILEILVRLKVDNEEGTLHDRIVDVVLKSGGQAVDQFVDEIAPNKFAQLFKELDVKFRPRLHQNWHQRVARSFQNAANRLHNRLSVKISQSDSGNPTQSERTDSSICSFWTTLDLCLVGRGKR